MAASEAILRVNDALKRSKTVRKSSKTLLGILALLALFTVCAVLISLLYGLLALLAEQLFAPSFDFEQIKGIITGATSIITWLLLPVAVTILCTYVLGFGSIKDGIARGLRSLNSHYFPTLLILLVAYGVGWLVVALFDALPQGPVFMVIEIVLLVLLTLAYVFVSLVLFTRTSPKPIVGSDTHDA